MILYFFCVSLCLIMGVTVLCWVPYRTMISSCYHSFHHNFSRGKKKQKITLASIGARLNGSSLLSELPTITMAGGSAITGSLAASTAKASSDTAHSSPAAVASSSSTALVLTQTSSTAISSPSLVSMSSPRTPTASISRSSTSATTSLSPPCYASTGQEFILYCLSDSENHIIAIQYKK